MGILQSTIHTCTDREAGDLAVGEDMGILQSTIHTCTDREAWDLAVGEDMGILQSTIHTCTDREAGDLAVGEHMRILYQIRQPSQSRSTDDPDLGPVGRPRLDRLGYRMDLLKTRTESNVFDFDDYDLWLWEKQNLQVQCKAKHLHICPWSQPLTLKIIRSHALPLILVNMCAKFDQLQTALNMLNSLVFTIFTKLFCFVFVDCDLDLRPSTSIGYSHHHEGNVCQVWSKYIQLHLVSFKFTMLFLYLVCSLLTLTINWVHSLIMDNMCAKFDQNILYNLVYLMVIRLLRYLLWPWSLTLSIDKLYPLLMKKMCVKFDQHMLNVL